MAISKKKVAILGAPFELCQGGAELQYSFLRDRLNKDYEFFFVCSDFYLKGAKQNINEESLVTFKGSRYEIGISNRYSRFLNTDIIKAYSILRSLSPDIIYSQAFDYVLLAGVLYGKRHKVPTIWHIASEKNTWSAKKQKRHKLDLFGPALMRYIVKHVDCIIGQADYEDELLQKNWSRSCDFIVPNWHPSPKEKVSKTPPLTVVWIGNFKGMKQPEMFIRLAEDMSCRQDVRFVMIGRGANGRWQAELTSRISRCPNLQYLGEKSMEDVNEMLRNAHILVCTSLYEGFPNTYIQSWFREVPVVALTVDPDDVLVRNGIGFCSGSYDQLRADVQKLLESASLREEMGAEAREYALTNHDIAKNAITMKHIFDNAGG